MLRAKRLFIAFTKFHEQSSALISSVCIVQRSFSSGDLDGKMSGKSLPKWIKPEGDGELKLYNSLTREKVNCWYFRPVSYIFLVIICLMQYDIFIDMKSANQINIRSILPPSLLIIQSKSLLVFFSMLIYSEQITVVVFSMLIFCYDKKKIHNNK